MPAVGVYATAREFLERALSVAEARQDRAEMHVIGERLCDLAEAEDFHEARRMTVQWVMESDAGRATVAAE